MHGRTDRAFGRHKGVCFHQKLPRMMSFTVTAPLAVILTVTAIARTAAGGICRNDNNAHAAASEIRAAVRLV